MADIIDLTKARNEREQPDPEHRSRDEFGCPLFKFALDFDHDGSVYSVDFMAYSWEDARAKVESMKRSLRVEGQVYHTVLR